MKRSKSVLNTTVLFCLTAVAVTAIACGSAPPPTPEEPAFTPSYSYSVQSSGEKIDVTVGLIAPQYGGKASSVATVAFPGMPAAPSPWEDALGRNFNSGMRSAFNELLSAKGFDVTGPFDSLENMTFPEKKGADFVLYPEIDVALSQNVESRGTGDGNRYWNVCEVTLSIGGNILIVAKEPLSGEKMWMKRVEIVGGQAQTFNYKTESLYELCQSVPLPRDAQNVKAKMLEDAFTTVMTALDKYVTGEEFQMLKKQAVELREKKAY